jgi:CRP-like cAMP-binding protein
VKFVACRDCPLRALPVFEPHADAEVALLESLKTEQIVVRAGQGVTQEGQSGAPLYTLLQGWAIRFKTLEDGRRQILNFLLPGDLIGAQQRMGAAMAHGVQALSDVVLCVFQRDALWELHRAAPELAAGITWQAARDESLRESAPLSAGRRGAEDRIANLLITLFRRVAALLPDGAARGVPFPLTQQHIADALGLSLAHTHKTLRRLEKRGMYRIEGGRLRLLDLTVLAGLEERYGDGGMPARPLV